MTESNSQRPDWLSRLLDTALQGMLPLFLLLVAFVGGTIALMITAREEEPQIVIPMADVLVSAPGLSAKQVERQIATPLEKRLYQAAVTRVGQLDFVIVKTPQGAVRRYVRLGEHSPDDRIEVISGLKPGDQIFITNP